MIGSTDACDVRESALAVVALLVKLGWTAVALDVVGRIRSVQEARSA